MEKRKKGSIEWLSFDNLTDAKLPHASFLKPLDFSQTDAKLEAASILGIEEIYSGKQCHGKEIAEITERFLERPSCDALMTQEKGKGLMILHADCQAAILFDPVQKALATVHSGWRGACHNIYLETIQKMQKQYGTNPANLLVGISPSLGPQSAEFIHYKNELPESFWEFQVKPTYFDFWEISRYQLLQAGVMAHHIEIAGMCTYNNPETCFSSRRGDKTSGRHATIAYLMD